MSSNPCKICGSTDLHLVDGFYYCVECGTQDINARETVVEQTLLADGTFAHTTIKKYKTVLQDSIEMSGEWHKWHAYNFILAGLTDELIALGAEASVKSTVMWVWVRYIKKFQVKDNKENDNNFDNDSLNGSKKYFEDSNHDFNDMNTSESYRSGKIKTEKFRWDINIVTKGTLLTILYIALNIDRSDIQLSHLLRFIREGRLSLYTCLKYVPKELSTKNIPHWVSFIKCQNEYTSKVIRALALTFFKRLDLGFPLVPNLNIIISNYVKELCLPDDFKDLVFSLMNIVPCDNLSLNSFSQKRVVRIPDYEGICMSYILVALKLCFGLDGEYELKLSDKVDKINYEENNLKSYKLGMYSEPSDRLFSFREWYKYLQFRKTILCKYYLPLARQLHMPVDDAVLMDHLEKRNKRKPKLSDEVTMDILNKMPLVDDKVTIQKNKFEATLTPMTAYTDIIQDYIQDPDFKLLISEDFSQYSLKYATKDLKLPGFVKSIKGVSKKNKIYNPRVSGTLKAGKGDTIMVFVRNCDNKNWLKTKPPRIEHVTKLINNKSSSENSDLGYDSTIEEPAAVDSELDNKDNEEIPNETLEDENEFETIENEDIDKSIFDDDFCDLETVDENKNDTKLEDNENIFEFNYNDVQDPQESKVDFQDSMSMNEQASASEIDFDPETFDRNKVIKELIDITCKKYKIPKPKEKEARVPQKRKKDMVNNEAGVSEPKKRNIGNKQQRDEARAATKELLATYYKNIENDLLVQVSEQFKSILENTEEQNDFNHETVYEPVNFDETHVQAENDTEVGITDIGQNESVISSIHPNHTFNDTAPNEEEDLNPKDNPNFDAKTHDIKQLYIKFNEDDSINYLDELLDIENDPDIEKIIEKKIDEYTQGDKQTDNITDITQISDLDDTNKVEEICKEKKKRDKPKLDPLINNTDLTKFNYWTRHYKTLPFVRSLDMNQKFDIELLENCPKSFVFVISECAAILDCTTFCLYKNMQNLEAILLNHNH